MWSKTTRKYYIWALESASWLHVVPYKWNRETKRVEMKSTRIGIFLWYINFVAEICFEIFTICRLCEMHLRDLGQAKDKISMKYTTTAYCLPVVFQLATYLRWDQYPIFVNSFIKLTEKFQEQIPETSDEGIHKSDISDDQITTNLNDDQNTDKERIIIPTKKSKIRNTCDPYIIYIFYIGRTIILVQMMSIFIRPKQRYLLTSLLADPKKASWAIRAPLGLFHVYMIWSLCFKMQLYTFTILAYVSPAILMLHQLRLNFGRGKSHNQDTFLLYRSMQIQHNMFNRIIGSIELPFTKGVLTTVAILSSFGAIKLEGLRPMVLSIVAMATIVTLKIIYQSIADLKITSTHVLQSWKNGEGTGRKWFRQNLTASRSLATRVGCLYTVSRYVVLVIMSIILDRTITLLLAF